MVIFISGILSEVDTVKSKNANFWLSLTPSDVDGKLVSIDGVTCGKVLVM